MGMVQAFFGLGALLGPVVGARLFVWSGAWQVPFYVFGVTGILMATIIAAAVPREFSDASEAAGVVSASGDDAAFSALLSRILKAHADVLAERRLQVKGHIQTGVVVYANEEMVETVVVPTTSVLCSRISCSTSLKRERISLHPRNSRSPAGVGVTWRALRESSFCS